jgi:hypothetical protein
MPTTPSKPLQSSPTKQQTTRQSAPFTLLVAAKPLPSYARGHGPTSHGHENSDVRECDGLQRVFDRNVRSYFGHWIYTPTNHDSDFLGAARAYYYKEYAAHDWAQIHALQHGT